MAFVVEKRREADLTSHHLHVEVYYSVRLAKEHVLFVQCGTVLYSILFSAQIPRQTREAPVRPTPCIFVFRQNAQWRFCMLQHSLRRLSSFVVRPSQSERLLYPKNKLTYNRKLLLGHPDRPSLQPYWI